MVCSDAVIKPNPDLIDKAYDTGVQGFKVTKKIVKVGKGVTKVADIFTHIPGYVDEALVTIKSFKFIGGVLAVRKLCKSCVKVIKPGMIQSRAYAGWKIVKSIKKIVGAVGAVFYYLRKLNLITKAALAWTAVTDWVFFPVSFISAALTTYDCGKKGLFLHQFRGRIKQEKLQGTKVEVATRITNYILSERKALGKLKIISKDCPLKNRLHDVLVKLKAYNALTRAQGVREAKMIRSRLKNRITEHVGVAAVDTAIAVAGVTSTILGLTCPPAALALTIGGLGLAVIKLASFAYSKFIPMGDIFEDEKRMLFARIAKGARRLAAAA